MKIYPIPVPDEFRPPSQNFQMPPHNPIEGYGVEQDFPLWLVRQRGLVTDDPNQADWWYVPMYWNRMYIKTWSWGQDEEAIDRCKSYIEHLWLEGPDFRRVFTICEWDLEVDRPDIDIHGMTVLTAARREERGIDIPCLCNQHDWPAVVPPKQWLASFAGNLGTHGLRGQMQEMLAGREDCHIEQAAGNTEYYVSTIQRAFITLAPRGFRGQTMRFYEAMDLGVVPMLIGDYDTRPFKNWIPWDECSLYRKNCEGLGEYLDELAQDPVRLLEMGQKAKQVYDEHLRYGQWCRYVIGELNSIP